MELAAASSVAGVVSLIVQVATLSCRYVSSVQNSTKTIKGYFHELETLKYVLRRFEDLLSDPRTAQHASAAVSSEVLGNFREELERLRSKLQKRSGESAFTNSLRRLSWPIVEEETRQLVEKLARYRGDIVALLGPDHFNLSVRIREAVEKVQTSIDTMQTQSILAWLDPMDQNYNQELARGRHEDQTGDWILEFEPFHTWLLGSMKHFWIKGRPGTGKTILCSTIIDYLQLNDAKTEATVYFYFDFSDHERQSVQAALRSLMSQMALRLGISAEGVETIYRDSGARAGTRIPTLQGLLNAFKEIAARFARVNIVLDGVDESTERVLLLDCVAGLCRDLAEVVHFLITSRPQRDIPESMGEEDVLAISLDDNKFVQTDIAVYVRSVLARDPKLKRRPPDVKVSIEQALIGKAGGVFRWTECQLEALRHCGTPQSIKRTLTTLPRSLEKTYETMLCKIRPEHQQYVKRALYLLCFSYKPLSQPIFVSEVAEFAVIDPAEEIFDRDEQFYDPEEILEYCSGLVYVVPTTNDVRLAHSSVKEYLVSEQISLSSAAHFTMSKQEAQNALAEGCLMYLASCDRLETGQGAYLTRYPFLNYATRNWHRHVRRGKDADTSRLDARVLRFLKPDSDSAFSNWLRHFQPDLFLDGDYAPSMHALSPLYVMAYFKCYEVIPLLMKSTNSIHCHGRGCGPALALAVRGDIELLENLIEGGCDLQCQLENGESIPAYAARRSSLEVLALLLDAGIEIAATDGNPSMVMVAIIHRRFEVVELLLEAGADVFELDRKFGSVLHAAVVYHRTERGFYQNQPDARIIQALIDWGAQPNWSDEIHGSVMHAAIVNAPVDIAATQLIDILNLLLGAGGDPNVGGGKFGTALQALLGLNISHKHKDMLLDLLLAADARVDFKGGFFGTSLQAVAASNTSRETAQLILGKTENLDEVCGVFGTALQAAAYTCNIPMILMLLNAGADVNVRGGYWGSALQAACHGENGSDPTVVPLLLDHGADVNAPLVAQNTTSGGTALQIAASRGRKDLMELLLLEGADVNAEGTATGPALHACLLGCHSHISVEWIYEIVRLLLEAGADVNQRGGSYGAPIIAASALGNHEILRLLIEKGADVTAVADHSCATALSVAVMQPNAAKTLPVLLSAGAQIDHKDAAGRTALDIACLKGNIEAANTLLSGRISTATVSRPRSPVTSSAPTIVDDEDFRKLFRSYTDQDEELKKLYKDVVYGNPTSDQIEELQSLRDVLMEEIASPESRTGESSELQTPEVRNIGPAPSRRRSQDDDDILKLNESDIPHAAYEK